MIHAQVNTGKFGGEFRGVLRNSDGSIAYDSGWFTEDRMIPNLVTDRGLVQYHGISISENSWFSRNTIGSGGSASTVSMVNLESFLAANGSASTIDQSPSVSVPPDYEFWVTRKWTYAPGSGTGTIREVGMEGVNENSGNLFCRAVFPTPIVKGATQYLDVFYKFTVWQSLVAQTGTALINGVNYDWHSSVFNVATPLNPAGSAFTNGGVPVTSGTISIYHQWYSGARAATITDTTPAGSNLGGASSCVIDDYGTLDANTGYCDFTLHFGLSVGNGTDFLRTLITRSKATKIYRQMEFTATDGPNIGEGIPKDNTQEMDISLRYTSGRL